MTYGHNDAPNIWQVDDRTRRIRCMLRYKITDEEYEELYEYALEQGHNDPHTAVYVMCEQSGKGLK